MLLQWPGPGMDRDYRPVGSPDSSHSNASDLVMIHMISVKYAFSLSSVVCLESVSDARVFAGPGAEAGPEATD